MPDLGGEGRVPFGEGGVVVGGRNCVVLSQPAALPRHDTPVALPGGGLARLRSDSDLGESDSAAMTQPR